MKRSDFFRKFAAHDPEAMRTYLMLSPLFANIPKHHASLSSEEKKIKLFQLFAQDLMDRAAKVLKRKETPMEVKQALAYTDERDCAWLATVRLEKHVDDGHLRAIWGM